MSETPEMSAMLQPERAPQWLDPLTHKLSAPGSASLVTKMQGHMRFASQKSKRAAVLMCFTGDPEAATLPDDAEILITHRTPSLRNHSGQMAFPGGKVDRQDSGPIDAALREAREETGLQPERVVPLAVLETIAVGPSGNPVNPVLAYAQEPGEVWSASPNENDDVFFVPLSNLINPDNRFRVARLGWSGPAFELHGYVVWGFTASLLSVMIREAGWEEPWEHKDAVDLRHALRSSRNGEGHGF
ncbi:CoA pyrophosphatase [Corynebacterium sp. CCUG 70398]|uniref:NUDIX hydrolase n=1 Tax=Corynebacterium sp. CCUG 70398 TaxID=2823891 RepID=UPI00210CBA4B|nr:CoA pyrophosphatase [Corynebacterium sp. CCUG 70398]MCQ4622607.1 CoA pyrophosphatase [Corynebacterium sp. CCUG 70398]